MSCGFKGSSRVIHVDTMRLMNLQLLADEGTLKGLEPPQSDEFDTQNYSVGIQKDEIEDDKIVEENYPRLVRNR